MAPWQEYFDNKIYGPISYDKFQNFRRLDGDKFAPRTGILIRVTVDDGGSSQNAITTETVDLSQCKYIPCFYCPVAACAHSGFTDRASVTRHFNSTHGKKLKKEEKRAPPGMQPDEHPSCIWWRDREGLLKNRIQPSTASSHSYIAAALNADLSGSTIPIAVPGVVERGQNSMTGDPDTADGTRIDFARGHLDAPAGSFAQDSPTPPTVECEPGVLTTIASPVQTLTTPPPYTPPNQIVRPFYGFGETTDEPVRYEAGQPVPEPEHWIPGRKVIDPVSGALFPAYFHERIELPESHEYWDSETSFQDCNKGMYGTKDWWEGLLARQQAGGEDGRAAAEEIHARTHRRFASTGDDAISPGLFHCDAEIMESFDKMAAKGMTLEDIERQGNEMFALVQGWIKENHEKEAHLPRHQQTGAQYDGLSHEEALKLLHEEWAQAGQMRFEGDDCVHEQDSELPNKSKSNRDMAEELGIRVDEAGFDHLDSDETMSYDAEGAMDHHVDGSTVEKGHKPLANEHSSIATQLGKKLSSDMGRREALDEEADEFAGEGSS